MNYTNTSAVFSINYTISNVSISDNGTYTCTVSNPIGSDNATMSVFVGKYSMYVCITLCYNNYKINNAYIRIIQTFMIHTYNQVRAGSYTCV